MNLRPLRRSILLVKSHRGGTMRDSFRNVAIIALCAIGISRSAVAVTVDPYYVSSYSATSIGSIPGLPSQYGGLAFLDNDTIVIGGAANTSTGRLYTVDVTRGPGGHVSGFAGTASQFGGPVSLIGDYNDGGVVFGPGGVLFLARWNVNGIGQVKPGTTADEDKIVVGPGDAVSSVSALNFVPPSFGGAGSLKVVSWSLGQWYNATFAPDGNGTFNIGPFVQVDVDPTVAGIQNVPGGPEGFVYVAAGNPLFVVNSMLVSEYTDGVVSTYVVDSNGNPLINTRRTLISGLTGAEGAAFDPVTGDYLFSTFGGGSQVVVLQGFVAAEPSSLALTVCGGAGLCYALMRGRIPRRHRGAPR